MKSSLFAHAKVLIKRMKRLPMHLMIRDLVSWRPLEIPEDGYTIAIACMRGLAPVVAANLKMCAATSSPNLREIILVFDCPENEIPELVRQVIREDCSSIDVRLLGYDKNQSRVARRINWGWVYAWASWCLAIGQARTRAVILHDLDAMPISPDFFERIYENWSQGGLPFCGIRQYQGNGVQADMGLVGTFELALDAEYMRRTFRPFDLFNKLKVIDGRVVDFDTTLYAQWLSPGCIVKPFDEERLVHPHQLICQYTDLVAGRSNYSHRSHSLFLLSYFQYLGGDPENLISASSGLLDDNAQSVVLFGKTAFVDGVTPEHWAWIEKQIRRLEHTLFVNTRPEIESCLAGVIRRAGAHRTVGREQDSNF
jgi:hypothetical protein